MYDQSIFPVLPQRSPLVSSSQIGLVYKALETSFAVPIYLRKSAKRSRDAYLAFLSSEPSTTNEEPSSTAELFARYLEYVVGAINTESQSHLETSAEFVRLLLDAFEDACLDGEDVHTFAAELACSAPIQRAIIRSYYEAVELTQRPPKYREPTLFRTAKDEKPKCLYLVFGGQGNTEHYFEELRDAYSTYPSFLEGLLQTSSDILASLSRVDTKRAQQYPKGLDFMSWLRDPNSTPPTNYLLSAPVSFPLIGLVQLVNYCVTCKVLRKSPGELLDRFKGLTGHSQGTVVAAAIATATTWEGFDRAVESALTTLFYIGYRSQQIFAETELPEDIVQGSLNAGEGRPSPMLNIMNLSQTQVQDQINQLNQHLRKEETVMIVLINSARNIVVGGPPLSLVSFNNWIRRLKTPEGADQSKTPSRERKLSFSSRFLPITVPFHSFYLENAEKSVEQDLKRHGISLKSSNLRIPVYHTNTGQDLRDAQVDDLLPELGRSVMTKMVDWPRATALPNATHIVDFGPGGTSGVGTILQRSKEGTGVHVILAGALNGTNSRVGYKAELFESSRAIKHGLNWSQDYAPGLLKDSSGKIMLATKMSKLLGIPPLMAAGMTPTTAHPDFVAAIINAGYHAELAAGGFSDAKSLTDAVKKLANSIPVGRGITINLIYSNPRAIQWQIPLIKNLQTEGLPIEGIALGAGVPSLDVATDYIRNLGIKHIAFKPGSEDTIQQVITIAKTNPHFPVILQWTGGRGGGHHSFEDFHQPILQMYGKIRRCHNIILVAGSGFGGPEAYPYISGSWSRRFGLPEMPLDGCLLGSRLMVAKEAHTSRAAKLAIAETEGLEDDKWQDTYKRAAGGIITVNSELGQPIHKVATRGVLLWAELDKTIFSLPKAKQVIELKRRRDYFIQRLNCDSQKVWFGRNSAGQAVDLNDMTYAEVMQRMVELLYVKHQSRWIHKSYLVLVADFVRRLEERLGPASAESQGSVFLSYDDFSNPFHMINTVLRYYIDAEVQIISAEDVQYFLSICRRRGQKPVTFIPVLDESFETWFKKDSLWQSEDLDAVVDQDVQRTCILHGPVAARHSRLENVDEPVKDILDRISNQFITHFNNDPDRKQYSTIPSIDYFHGKVQELASPDSYDVYEEKEKITYVLPSSVEKKLPSAESWLGLLAGEPRSWRHAFFRSRMIVQRSKLVANPIQRIFAPAHGTSVEISLLPYPKDITIVMKMTESQYPLVDIKIIGPGVIIVSMSSAETAEGHPVPLEFIFSYHPETTHALIHENMDKRNERIKSFYSQVWLGRSQSTDAVKEISTQAGQAERMEIDEEMIKSFIQAIGTTSEYHVKKLKKKTEAPMDFAIVIGWKAIVKALLSVNGDLLKLVHLSNKYQMLSRHTAFKVGDEVESKATVTSVLIQDSGKMVEIVCKIGQAGTPVMKVTSTFLYRGHYTEFAETFKAKTVPPIELSLDSVSLVDLITSREWFHQKASDPRQPILLHQKLIFKLKNLVTFETKSTYASINTTGKVFVELPFPHKHVQVATVDYQFKGYSKRSLSRNPVLDFLERHGTTMKHQVPLEKPISLGDTDKIVFTAPASNESYAKASKDFNPIHVSHVFARYADLPGPITHGMHTNAIVRGLCEKWGAQSKSGAMRSFDASFCGMVQPGDKIVVEICHVAMVEGRKVLTVEARNKSTQEIVLTAECELEAPPTAYFFTGQGSQEVNMGMELYASSKVARGVWDRADKHFDENFGEQNPPVPYHAAVVNLHPGFRISDIVKNNPKKLTIHFGGRQGAILRRNYLQMTYQCPQADGASITKPFFDINEHSPSHTFHAPNGLLNSTEFTQPALMVMEKALFDDLIHKQLVLEGSQFAGHSLGEYSALAAMANMMSLEQLLSVVFYRGLSMQVAVDRDANGRSDYGMLAMNPSRISKGKSHHHP